MAQSSSSGSPAPEKRPYTVQDFEANFRHLSLNAASGLIEQLRRLCVRRLQIVEDLYVGLSEPTVLPTSYSPYTVSGIFKQLGTSYPLECGDRGCSSLYIVQPAGTLFSGAVVSIPFWELAQRGADAALEQFVLQPIPMSEFELLKLPGLRNVFPFATMSSGLFDHLKPLVDLRMRYRSHSLMPPPAGWTGFVGKPLLWRLWIHCLAVSSWCALQTARITLGTHPDFTSQIWDTCARLLEDLVAEVEADLQWMKGSSATAPVSPPAAAHLPLFEVGHPLAAPPEVARVQRTPPTPAVLSNPDLIIRRRAIAEHCLFTEAPRRSLLVPGERKRDRRVTARMNAADLPANLSSKP